MGKVTVEPQTDSTVRRALLFEIIPPKVGIKLKLAQSLSEMVAFSDVKLVVMRIWMLYSKMRPRPSILLAERPDYLLAPHEWDKTIRYNHTAPFRFSKFERTQWAKF